MLKKQSLILITALFFVSLAFQSIHSNAEPAYAKWGRLAMQETQKKYPESSIIDYQHIGRTLINQNQAEEKFRLWLRREDKTEFGVLVTMLILVDKEELHSIEFNEEQ